MTRTVQWTLSALDDLDAGLGYIADHDEAAAEKLRQKIMKTVDLVTRHSVGRTSRVPGHFEKSIAGTRYTLCYSISGETVTIDGVIHQSRDWPAGRWPSS